MAQPPIQSANQQARPPRPVLTKGALQTMVFGSPIRYRAILQVLRYTGPLRKNDGTPHTPRLYLIDLQDGTYNLTALAHPRLVAAIEGGQIQRLDVLEVTEFWQALGGQSYTIMIVRWNKLGNWPLQEQPKKLLMSLEPAPGRGEIGSVTHLQAGFPAQEHAPLPNRSNNNQVRWRKVSSTVDCTDAPPDYDRRVVPPRSVIVTYADGTRKPDIAQIRPGVEPFILFARVYEVAEATRMWDNDSRRYTYFMTAILLDATGEIEIIGYDQFVGDMKKLVRNSVYRFTGLGIEPSPAQYTRVPHKYRVVVRAQTAWTEVDDDGRFPPMFLHWTTLNAIQYFRQNEAVDVVAVVARIGGKGVKSGVMEGARATLGHKRAPSSDRLDVWLVDDSRVVIRLCCFDGWQEAFLKNEGRCATIKSALVDFRDGPCLKTSAKRTKVLFGDNNAAHQRVMDWWRAHAQDNNLWRTLTGSFSAEGFPVVIQAMPNETYTIKDALARKLGMDHAKTFIVVAKILPRRWTNITYLGCPYEECNKKWNELSVTDTGDYKCDACKRNYVAPGYKYRFVADIQDATGKFQIFSFNTATTNLLQQSAAQMADWAGAQEFEPHNQYMQTLDRVIDHEYRMYIKATADSVDRGLGRPNWVVTYFERT